MEGVAQFGGMQEVRVGWRSQKQPVFVRMLDKSSVWGYKNGLKTMITTLLQFGMIGRIFTFTRSSSCFMAVLLGHEAHLGYIFHMAVWLELIGLMTDSLVLLGRLASLL